MYRLPLLALLVLTCPAAAADERPMQVDDLFKFKRVAEPQISPDGKLVVYQVGTVNLADNKTSTSLWLATTDGKSSPRQLTNAAGKKDTHPRWSPDGKSIMFESNRSGTSQIWLISLDGGEAKQLTTISTEASNAIWAPDGTSIAFVSAVFPEYSEKSFKESDELNKKKLDEREKSPVKARVFNQLFYRHWVEYVEDKRQHLFALKVAYRKDEPPFRPTETWGPIDVTPGDRDANPTSTTFSVGDDFTFSPDGKFLVFTAVPEKNPAWSTNYDICRVAINNHSTKWETLTKDNPAGDGSPRFSPDGKKLAYRAQKKAGYEADRWDLYVVDCDETGSWQGVPKPLIASEYRSVQEFAWRSNDYLVFGVEQNGGHYLHRFLVGSGKEDGGVNGIWPGSGSGISFCRDGSKMSCAHAMMNRPNEVMVFNFDTKVWKLSNVSRANDALLAKLDLPRPESVQVDVEGGVKMQMWILKPPGFDPAKKWPVAYLVHGGPQGVWEDGWSFRWCPELWAAQGYVVALPNPRGSTGFGQKFVDEISGDWGGKCYRDLMAGADYVEKLPYVDKERIAAAGASFGGYMMDWFSVNTGRFKTLISHCSVWDFESMWGTTDELWFDEYEHGGLPWEKPQKYREFSPHVKAGNLGKFKTPMLLIQNDLDFRCPVGQGHELFSALQRQGVPSKLINFPDEGHWVLKPKNSEFWHKEVFAWLKKYCPPGGK